MPLYDYKCPSCEYEDEISNRVEDRKKQHCPRCKRFMILLIKPVNVTPRFPEGMWESISDDGPMYISSKKHLREECKKHGVSSRYLND